MRERASGVCLSCIASLWMGLQKGSIIRLFSGDALWHGRLVVGPHRNNDFVVAISSPKKSLVVSSPSPPGSLLSWTNGTCVGLVAELRGTVDFPSVRRPAVSMMNDVEGPASSWRAPPCVGVRSRLLDRFQVRQGKPLETDRITRRAR